MTSHALPGRDDPPTGLASSNGISQPTAAPTPADLVEQLLTALASNRRIGLALGILMRDQDIDEDSAFDRLRRVSQNSNRKLRDVAEDVIQHRTLPPEETSKRSRANPPRGRRPPH